MNYLLRLLLKGKLRQKKQKLDKNTTGFTLIELLVGTIIATLLIVPMLTFVIDILNRDVREQAKTNTEQELQATIDYIAQDMSQAIHIYDSTEVDAITALADDDRPIPIPTGADPILVFWKREYRENVLTVAGCTANATNDCLDDTFVNSLVAYYLVTDTNATWCQPSGDTCPKRITRVEISDALPDEAITNGYNPGNINDRSTYKTATALTRGDGDFPNTQVLVNYVEDFILDSVFNNDLAEITIVGNSLRRIENDFSCEEDPSTDPPTYKNSPFCPKATAQLGGRSGFGE